MPERDDVLREVFGFDGLRRGQERIVDILMAGRPALALFPTGGGKSLCYQLPALLLEGLTLVVSPLLALMAEQVETLRGRGVRVERLDSTLPLEEVERVYRSLAEGQVKILYVAPERFANARFRKVIRGVRVALLAIDEAHCISEWGHNFRPDYLKLADFAKSAGVERCLAVTATARPEVAADICRAFDIAGEDRVTTGFRRENLALRVTPCGASERDELLAAKVRGVEGAVIVYVTQQFTAEAVARRLRESGIGARAYHAGLRDEARREVQEGFMRGTIRVVVATIAFGMGIDKGNIRAVFHYNLPKTLENYVQEVGRAGRDGEESHCEVLACLDDVRVLENFIYGSTPDASALKSVLEHILLVGPEIEVSFYDLSRSCDVKDTVVETLFAYLELGGWVKAEGASWGAAGIRFCRSEKEALAGHSRERQSFLRQLFGCGTESRGWLWIEVDELARELGEDVGKIWKSLRWLESHGDIRLRVAKAKRRFSRLKEVSRADLRVIVERIQQQFEGRERRDLERLDQVIEFLESGECLVLRLLSYFGIEDERCCGKCTSCLENAAGDREIPGGEGAEISIDDLEVIQRVMAERQAALRSSRQLARFLCGLPSPASTAAGLKRHRAHGILEGSRFEDVLIAVEALCKRPI